MTTQATLLTAHPARSRLNALQRPDRGGDESYHGPRADGRWTAYPGLVESLAFAQHDHAGLAWPSGVASGVCRRAQHLRDDSLGRVGRWRYDRTPGPSRG